jgi:hypothetical protein
LGKSGTQEKILPILMELLKDENYEVKLKVIEGMSILANVMGPELLSNTFLL